MTLFLSEFVIEPGVVLGAMDTRSEQSHILVVTWRVTTIGRAYYSIDQQR